MYMHGSALPQALCFSFIALDFKYEGFLTYDILFVAFLSILSMYELLYWAQIEIYLIIRQEFLSYSCILCHIHYSGLVASTAKIPLDAERCEL